MWKKTQYGYAYYHRDHLGTPLMLTDKTNAVVWEARYKAFGERNILTAAIANNLGFPGQYYEEETGLWQNWFRDYDHRTGRYVEGDPIGLGGGVNVYAYARDNPLSHIDIQGLDIYLCNRTVKIGPEFGNHAYIWDTRNKKCCGRNKGRNPLLSCSEKGPGLQPGKKGDSCVLIPGSSGKEDKIMDCCEKNANNGPWFPPFNDCHTSVEDCIEAAGLTYPGAPGGRTGTCDSCWAKPYDDGKVDGP